jgi:hypothetical protein
MMYTYIVPRGEEAMVRTQIYLDEKQKAELDRLSVERRVTVSDLIRQAVDQFLGKGRANIEIALENSFGVWKDRDDVGEARAHVRKIRREWDKRERRA